MKNLRARPLLAVTRTPLYLPTPKRRGSIWPSTPPNASETKGSRYCLSFPFVPGGLGDVAPVLRPSLLRSVPLRCLPRPPREVGMVPHVRLGTFPSSLPSRDATGETYLVGANHGIMSFLLATDRCQRGCGEVAGAGGIPIPECFLSTAAGRRQEKFHVSSVPEHCRVTKRLTARNPFSACSFARGLSTMIVSLLFALHFSFRTIPPADLRLGAPLYFRVTTASRGLFPSRSARVLTRGETYVAQTVSPSEFNFYCFVL
jgi:hypothetical protein